MQTLVYAAGDIVNTCQLQSAELSTRYVGERTVLESLTTADSYRRDNAELHTPYRVLSAKDTHWEILRDRRRNAKIK